MSSARQRCVPPAHVLPHPYPTGCRVQEGGPHRAPRRAAQKLIVDPRPRAFVPWSAGGTLGRIEGLRPHQVQLIAGPLYHDGPFFWSHHGLFEHHRLVVMERFDATLAVDLIERHRVQFACLVPTMMRRIARLPDIGARDLSSIEAVFHAAAPCPAWLKHAWFDLIGPEQVIEGYGSTEAVGETTIAGDEWLEHPGSVGRATGGSELRILDQAGGPPSRKIVEIYMRPAGGVQTYAYVGAPPQPRRRTGSSASATSAGSMKPAISSPTAAPT